MEELTDVFNRINTSSTDNLQVSVIQELLLKTRNKQTVNEKELWSKISDELWQHLSRGLTKFDDQLLCATCFFTVLNLTTKEQIYLEKVSALILSEISSRSKCYKAQAKTPLLVSLMYGMFQSTFLTNKCTEDIPNVVDVLKSSVDLLITMASEYSRYTFLVFKTLNAFKKVLGTIFQETIFCKSNLMRLLNLVNHNWENPITGVRDLNKLVFKALIGLLDQDLYGSVLREVNSFHWNKAKYLMLSEVVDQYRHNIVHFTLNYDWVDGVLYSLHKPGLVSAGADMYYAILKHLNTYNEWCTLFEIQVLNILNGKNIKAIENFSNYWCLTTFKRFPELLEILVHRLSQFERLELNLYSSLCILKQGNKLGLMNKQSQLWEETNKYVTNSLEHCNPHIRMSAFEIISITHGKYMPSSSEYTLILDYLQNNMNSDCTVLRISMLNNFKFFLQKLSESSRKYNKDNCCDILDFYIKLQKLIIQSLNLNGNYQRKVTTIKLCHTFLSSLNEVPKKRQKKGTLTQSSLITTLKEKETLMLFKEEFIINLFMLLKDPADDIREGTVQLLLNHFSKQMTSKLINNLIADAMTGIQSKFFFQISCGHSTFRLLTSLFINETYNGTVFKTVDDIFSYAYNELYTEYNTKRNIVKSIEGGKQLHSLLSVLIEVLQISKQNSFKIKIVFEKFSQLLEILRSISSQFMWEEETATSSDFSKMNDMIQNMIISSGYDPLDEKDFTKISGLQQIVLNCLWFNVKASCDLASLLLQFLDDQQTEQCEKCLTIIMHVLEASRHKGVIEAAGAALGRGIQYLTSLPEESHLSKIPLTLLKCKLNELISYANMASVTRRGAGLSIMVHRIVSSDMKRGKPLFHYFMETVLSTCNDAKDVPADLDESQRDLPKAIYIHFLTRIVIDSSLASDMMYYSVELAEIAFENLISPHWQIRNAALQLYGALIPKLIGQKKASGTDIETVATVACDELRTHSPGLWARAVAGAGAGAGAGAYACAGADTCPGAVQAHSNVLPVLNVLANLARRYSFSFDTPHDTQLLNSLMLLLGSPIFTVRRLSAKCIYNIYDIKTIIETIMNQEIKTENALHGSLILVVICHKNYMLQEDFEMVIKKFAFLLNNGTHSYLCKLEFEKLFTHENFIHKIQETIEEAKLNKRAPGVSQWANSRFRNYTQHCPWEAVPDILRRSLEERYFDDYSLILILNRLKTETVSKDLLVKIYSTLLEHENISKSNVACKMLYYISSQVNLSDQLISMSILGCLKTTEEISYRSRYAIPILANFAAKLSNEHLEKLSNIIVKLSDPETSDVDMRHIAALANNDLAKSFSNIPGVIKINAIKVAVILLQDEDEEVRCTSIEFYKILSQVEVPSHSFVCLSQILNRTFLLEIFDNPNTEMPLLCQEITLVLSSYSKKDVDKFNPFSSESKNIFFEIGVVKVLLNNLTRTFE